MLFHPMHDYYGTGDWLWSIFSTAVFIGLFVAAIMLLVRIFSGPRQQGPGRAPRSVGGPWYGPGSGTGGPGGPPTAEATRPAWRGAEAEGAERILAERYARGEISEDEYRGRLEVLRQAASPGWPTAHQFQPQQAPAQPQTESPVQGRASEDQGTPTRRTGEAK